MYSNRSSDALSELVFQQNRESGHYDVCIRHSGFANLFPGYDRVVRLIPTLVPLYTGTQDKG
jgi:hypothetical protein